MKKSINPTDTIIVTFFHIKTYYDGTHSHDIVKVQNMTGDDAKSIANIGRTIYNDEKSHCLRNWNYIRIFNKTQDWCEDYNISRWGNMSVRKTIY